MDNEFRESLMRVLDTAEGSLCEPHPHMNVKEDRERVKALLKDCNRVRDFLGMTPLKLGDFITMGSR